MRAEYSNCRQCGEYRKATLRKSAVGLCHNCADKRHKKGECQACHGDNLPLELHHPAGKKHAPATIPICLNCHAILSRRQYEWPTLWLNKPCPLFLIWGILDCYVLTLDPTVPFEIFSNRCEQAMAEATRKNVIGPYSLIQIMLFFFMLVWAIKAIPASTINFRRN